MSIKTFSSGVFATFLLAPTISHAQSTILQRSDFHTAKSMQRPNVIFFDG